MRRTTSLALLALALCGCGAAAPARTVRIGAPAGARQARLACQRGVAAPGCDLRVYEVMVEAFIDADPAADFGVGYGPSPHRGDLAGVTAALDHVAALGLNTLWLTPVFSSAPVPGQDLAASRLDATGYYATDYFTVDPRFGTLDGARRLVDEAHRRGLRVLFDGAFGHFKAGAAAEPAGAPHPGLLPASHPGGPAGCAVVDWSDPAALTFFTDVATWWIRTLGIDGWRLDQAYQVPPAALSAIRAAVAGASAEVTYAGPDGAPVHPLGYVVAEVWDGGARIASAAYGTDAAPALDSAFDFPMRYALVQTLATQEDTHAANAARQPATTFDGAFAQQDLYPAHAMPNLMLGNHDLVRFGDLVQRAGLGDPGGDGYWARHAAAFTFMAAQSGPITLYYGEEIGQELPGYAAQVTAGCADLGMCDDHVSRTSGVVEGLPGTVGAAPAVLDDRQRALQALVTRLMTLRAGHAALTVGARTHLHGDAALWIDLKDAGADRVVLALDVAGAPETFQLAPGAVGGAEVLTDLLTGERIPLQDGLFTVTVPGTSARLLAVQ